MINTVTYRVSRLVGLKQHSGANNNNIAKTTAFLLRSMVYKTGLATLFLVTSSPMTLASSRWQRTAEIGAWSTILPPSLCILNIAIRALKDGSRDSGGRAEFDTTRAWTKIEKYIQKALGARGFQGISQFSEVPWLPSFRWHWAHPDSLADLCELSSQKTLTETMTICPKWRRWYYLGPDLSWSRAVNC